MLSSRTFASSKTTVLPRLVFNSIARSTGKNSTASVMTPSLLSQRRTPTPSSSTFLVRTLSSWSSNPTKKDSSQRTLSTQTSTVTSHELFPSWNTPKVTCNGDYREEAWLEDLIGGSLYAKQKELPRLPVCDIQDSLQRLAPTALPLCRSQQEEQNLKAAMQKFPQQASKLQTRLEQRAQEYHDSSWLQHWWNTAGYLQVRDPVTVNVSYFFQYANDASASTNIQRGAALLYTSALYRKDVCSGQLPTETIGKKDRQTPLCSTAYKYMFHACRIPQHNQDAYDIYDPSLHNHVIVMRKGHAFKVNFCCPQTGRPYPIPVLEQALQECVEQADVLEGASDERTLLARQLGWCTSSNRDDWATARQALLENSGPKMKEALETLQAGALCLCLDDVEPVSRAECANMLLTGTTASGHNRWFDKSIQLVVANNGKAGFLGEHSMMDGMPLVGLANLHTQMTHEKCVQDSNAIDGVTVEDCAVTPVFEEAWSTMGNFMEPYVAKAKNDFTDLVNRHEIHVQSFQGYGSDFIKQSGFSPDAFVQMAMQVATYRLWGEQAGTYEATQVRPFLHGRTETTRSVSTESAAFCNAMGLRRKDDESDEAARKEKLALLQAAVSAHVKYIGLAAKAQGVDRHFLGLSMLVQDGEAMPDLYADPVFIRAKRWRVSTSHLTHPKFDNWGYGEVVPDGVGLAYSIHKRHCVFNITALKEHGWTDKLSQLLEESLLEMRTLIETDTMPTSRL